MGLHANRDDGQMDPNAISTDTLGLRALWEASNLPRSVVAKQLDLVAD